MEKERKFSLTQRKGRCVQVMFEGTNKWISSGCYAKSEAVLWAEAKLKNNTGMLQNPIHQHFRLYKRNGRPIQVKFEGSKSVLSSGYYDEINATLWAEAKYKEFRNNDIKLRDFSEGFYTRTDEMSFRAFNERNGKYNTDHYYAAMNGRLQNYILPAFGDVYLSMIDNLAIEKWFVTLKRASSGKPLSPDSKNKVLECFSNIMQNALKQGLVFTNPCDLVDKVVERHDSREPFTEEEMELLFPKADDELLIFWGGLMWATYFLISKCTGFRPGEISGLTVDNYYPDLGGLVVNKTFNTYKQQIMKRIKTSEKGKKGKIGFLSPQAIKFLEKLIENLPPGEEYLFKIGDRHIISETANKHFVTCAKSVIDLRGRTQYCLRHTFQTMLAGEIEEKEILELMGHTKYRDDYDHRKGGRRLKQLQGLREKLNEII